MLLDEKTPILSCGAGDIGGTVVRAFSQDGVRSSWPGAPARQHAAEAASEARRGRGGCRAAGVGLGERHDRRDGGHHLRLPARPRRPQGRDVAAEATLLAVAGWTSTVVLLVLVARRHRLPALFAAAFAISVAAGFIAAHALPHRSAVSDSYSAAEPDVLSWALVVLPVLAALNLVARAAKALRRPSSPAAV